MKPIRSMCLSPLLVVWAAPTSAPAAAGPGESPKRGADLMNSPVTVTTRKQRALRDAPGVVTVITRDDIMASGARDLAEVLEFVPGLQFGVDVEGALGPIVRGQWGTEGKVLLLVDGLEMNERLYGTNQWGMGLPVELIERIEVIRGPGSVVYGGFAELAVIQVTTVRPATLEGLELHGSGALMDTRFGRGGGAVAFGRVLSEDLAVSVAGARAHGAMSPGTYTPPSGLDGATGPRDLSGARQDARWLDAAVTYGGLSLRLLYDGQSHDTLDAYGEGLERASELSFTGYFVEAEYRWVATEALTLTPHAGFKRQQPWRSADADLSTFYRKTVDTYDGGLTLDAALLQDLDVQVAAEVSHDRARLDDDRLLGTQRRFAGEESLTVSHGTAYAQAIWHPELLTLVAGLRGDWSDAHTGTVVPRMGVLWHKDRFFVKGLASMAYRAPALENVGLAGPEDVQPERTAIFEAEAGYTIPYAFALTVNAYEMELMDPIVFTYDAQLGGEMYANERPTGTRGVEVVQRTMGYWGQTEVSYSRYTADGLNRVHRYAVPGDASALLGAAQHKVAFRGRFLLPGRVTVGPSGIFTSERPAVVGNMPWAAEPDGREPRIRVEPPTLRLNLFVSFTPPGVEGLYVGAGGFDLTDSGHRWVQPHDSGHAPMPGAGREWVLKVGYALPLGDPAADE